MMLFLFIFFNLFLFSFQTVQAAIFCDNYLRGIYVIEGSSERKIEDGNDGNWTEPYIFNNLNATPGDLIKIKCYNLEGGTSVAGCFLVKNECLCYMFRNNESYEYGSEYNNRKFDLDSKECDINVYMLYGIDYSPRDHYYQDFIPLDVSTISCKKYIAKCVPSDNNQSLKLSEYIYADFDIKNVEVSIIENYDYFTLNGQQLEEHKRFNILDELIFNSKDKGKIHFKFTNYGKILNDTKDCEFYIRVCHERCLECYDKDSDETHHRCKKCRDGFYLVENIYNCNTKQEIDWTKYYLNETEKMFKRCYKECKTNLPENLEEFFFNGDFDTSGIENGENEVQ